MKLVGTLGAALIVLAATPAWPVSFGIFSTPDCSSCNLSMPQGSIGTFYVRALVGPWAHIVGAELRVAGLPPEWIVVSVTPNPHATLVLGSLLGAGTNIAFAADENGECIDLFTVQVFATTQRNDVVLRVTKHATPSNPLLQCPVYVPNCWRLSGEDAKCYTFLCAGGGSMFVNSSTDCTVAAQPATWSLVRRLYR